MSIDDAMAAAADDDADGFEWAVVEIFGHRSHAGRTREEERFGSKMLRIDVPAYTPEPTLFDAAEGKPPAPEVTWTTHWYGGSSIFSYTLTDEASVRRINAPYRRPGTYSLPAPDPEGDIEFDDHS